MVIRKLTSDDLVFLNEVRNTYCEEYLHDSRKFSIEETIEWFNKLKPDYYIIEVDNKRVGYFRITNYSKVNRNLYIGADIHPEHKGKGLGYLAYKKFIPELFEKYNLHKIYLEVLATNEIAISLYRKLGFEIEGIKKEDTLKGDTFVNSIIMSIFNNKNNV